MNPQPDPTELSVLEQTLSLLDRRVYYFESKQISMENTLMQLPIQHSIRTLSDIETHLRQFIVEETPLQSALNEIYTNRGGMLGAGSQVSMIRFIIPPSSEGEDSLSEESSIEPTFRWFCSRLIDSSQLVLDQPEVKSGAHKTVEDWTGINQLLISNINQNIHIKAELTKVEEYLRIRFDKLASGSLRRIKDIYFKGRPALILQFSDFQITSFCFINMQKIPMTDFFGDQCEIWRIQQNRLKEVTSTSAVMLFRYIPRSFTKQYFVTLLKKVTQPLWVEDFVQINGSKHTIVRVNYLEDVFNLVASFNDNYLKDIIKICLHPKSAKKWKPALNELFGEHFSELTTE